jgi:hypothetical protein
MDPTRKLDVHVGGCIYPGVPAALLLSAGGAFFEALNVEPTLEKLVIKDQDGRVFGHVLRYLEDPDGFILPRQPPELADAIREALAYYCVASAEDVERLPTVETVHSTLALLARRAYALSHDLPPTQFVEDAPRAEFGRSSVLWLGSTLERQDGPYEPLWPRVDVCRWALKK